MVANSTVAIGNVARGVSRVALKPCRVSSVRGRSYHTIAPSTFFHSPSIPIVISLLCKLLARIPSLSRSHGKRKRYPHRTSPSPPTTTTKTMANKSMNSNQLQPPQLPQHRHSHPKTHSTHYTPPSINSFPKKGSPTATSPKSAPRAPRAVSSRATSYATSASSSKMLV